MTQPRVTIVGDNDNQPTTWWEEREKYKKEKKWWKNVIFSSQLRSDIGNQFGNGREHAHTRWLRDDAAPGRLGEEKRKFFVVLFSRQVQEQLSKPRIILEWFYTPSFCFSTSLQFLFTSI